jgi:hypothetical protein
MDQRLQYEQLIAGKLEKLPIPTMEDAIWARVKAELDIDLPPDDEEFEGPQSPSGPGIIGWGLSIVIIALITSLFINQNEPEAKNLQNITGPTEQILSPAKQNNSPPVTESPTPFKAEGDQNTLPPVVSLPNDSIQQKDVSATISDAIDSNKVATPLPSVTMNEPRDSIPAVKKKGKGVTGLKDDDYKIVPKKDND